MEPHTPQTPISKDALLPAVNPLILVVFLRTGSRNRLGNARWTVPCLISLLFVLFGSFLYRVHLRDIQPISVCVISCFLSSFNFLTWYYYYSGACIVLCLTFIFVVLSLLSLFFSLEARTQAQASSLFPLEFFFMSLYHLSVSVPRNL